MFHPGGRDGVVFRKLGILKTKSWPSNQDEVGGENEDEGNARGNYGRIECGGGGEGPWVIVNGRLLWHVK